MSDILKERVLKDLNELLKVGVNTKSAIVKVEDGFFDEDLLDWSDEFRSTRDATDIILTMTRL
jgi:hypothetical protein